MAHQKTWNKYEVALLIECYINVKEKDCDLDDELVMLSESLRNMAVSAGERIDDVYRNMNGMRWQYGFIKSAFEKEEFETRGPSSLFVQMVDIYKSNRDEYVKILKEAYRLASKLENTMVLEDTKQKFIEWLATRESCKNTPSVYVDCLSRVSDYAVAHKISKTVFWKIIDYKEFNRIRVALSAKKIFKFSHPHLFKNFENIGKLYSDFLKVNIASNILLEDKTVFEEAVKTRDTHTIPASQETVAIIPAMQGSARQDDSVSSPNGLDRYKEKEMVSHFFDGEIDIVDKFIDLYEYQKKTCPSIILDVRATIIGAKLNGERLRFYVDKQGRIYFSKLKLEDKRYVKPFKDSSLSDFYIAVDESNNYFKEHPEDVKLNGTVEIAKQDKASYDDVCYECSKILEAEFINGFKLGNILARKRFYSKYEETFGKSLDLGTKEFEDLLYKIGFNYENVIYASNILADDSKNIIVSYIIRTLHEDTQVIYYSTLYEQFKEFLLSYIYNWSMLKSYLKFINYSGFYCGDEYVSLYRNVQVDLKKEIINVFLNAGKPLTYDEIYAKLPNIEKEQINAILRDRDFIVNYKGKSYFYKEIFVYTEEQIDSIKEFLYARIGEAGASSGSELYAYICEYLSEMCETNPDITDLGFRGFLRLQLEDEFDFRGDIISLDGQKVDVSELYEKFCLGRESFSFDELNAFKAKINANVYFDVVFNNAIRVNETQYVRQDKIQFDSDKIDEALERFFNDDYLPFENVIYYTDFPTMDYPWNEYLLESYVYSFSKKFALLHKSFNQSFPTGAIVRKASSIKTWEDLLIKVLKDNKINGEIMTVNEAFNFLREHRYITVRRAKDIELIIAKAKR